jgi:hypothetical protein
MIRVQLAEPESLEQIQKETGKGAGFFRQRAVPPQESSPPGVK